MVYWRDDTDVVRHCSRPIDAPNARASRHWHGTALEGSRRVDGGWSRAQMSSADVCRLPTLLAAAAPLLTLSDAYVCLLRRF